MKKITITLLLAIVGLSAMASHIQGGEIYYDQISSTKYRIVLKLYRDVTGVQLPTTANVIQTSATTANVTHVLTVSKTEFINVQCNVSMEVKTYESIVTIGSIPAGGYDLYWSSCCRSPGISNISSSAGFYIQARMLPIPGTSVAGNSPRFALLPQFGITTNTTSTINNFSIDPDFGDSLFIDFSPLKENTGTNIAFGPAYSYSEPFDTNTVTTMLHNTGLITVVNPSNGLYAYAVKVKSYSNGILTSVVHRDIIAFVSPQIITVPTITVSNISVTGGTHAKIGDDYYFEVAERGTVEFDLEGMFSTGTDTVELIANGNMLDTAYGGFCTGSYCASFVGINGGLIGAGSAKGYFHFTPDTNFVNGFGTRTEYFLMEARFQDSCGIQQSKIVNIAVKVKGSTIYPAFDNYRICKGNPVKAQVFGDTTNLMWSPSAGVSNTTSASPFLSPLSTTVYTVTNLNDSSSFTIDVLVDTPLTSFSLNLNGAELSIPASVAHTGVTWMYNGLPVAVNQDTLPILLSGSYYAFVSNHTCTGYSDTLKINLKNSSQSSNLNGSSTTVDSISAAEFWVSFNLGENELTKINFVIPDSSLYKTSSIGSLEIYEYSTGSIPIATLNVTQQSSYIWSTPGINLQLKSGKDYHFVVNMNNDRLPLFNPDSIPYVDNNNFLTFKLATVKLNPVGVVNNVIPYMTFEFASAIGIKENNSIEHSIFPNPFDDNLTVKANGLNTLTVMDELGRVVIAKEFTNTIHVSTDMLLNGIYFYKIDGEYGTGTGKIVK